MDPAAGQPEQGDDRKDDPGGTSAAKRLVFLKETKQFLRRPMHLEFDKETFRGKEQ